MNSETSTDGIRLKPDTTGVADSRVVADSLQPWHFFVLAALCAATVVTFLSRGQGVAKVVLTAVMMGAASLVALAALRVLQPLLGAQDDRTSMIGERTRVALEREKLLVLKSIKELEFDRAMGKLSDLDWQDMSGRLRARAARLMRQLDAGAGYRGRIELDLAKRLGPQAAPGAGSTGAPSASPSAPLCQACSTSNDADAKFCKSCGQKL